MFFDTKAEMYIANSSDSEQTQNRKRQLYIAEQYAFEAVLCGSCVAFVGIVVMGLMVFVSGGCVLP